MSTSKRKCILTAAGLAVLWTVAAGLRLSAEKEVQMKKLTPVLIVDAIEPCLPFWIDRLGFEKTAEVPQGDTLGFVILKKDEVEVMLQSRASVQEDVPALAQGPYRSALFIEVDEVAPIVEALKGADVVLPLRDTFYGAREIGVREPGGNIVTFAQFLEKASDPGIS